MLGRDDESNRLRQSMPFVGLLAQHSGSRAAFKRGCG